MGEIQDRLQETIDGLIGHDGIIGAALVSRDGIPVGSAFTPALEEMPFSILVEGAMTATLMGAAEVAMQEVEAGQTRRVIVETDEFKMVLVGAGDDLLLVTLAEAARPLEGVLSRVEEAVGSVGEAMARAEAKA